MRTALILVWAGLTAALVQGVAQAGNGASPGVLPRFTEEREAAALFFVRKHVPELIPLLDGLKKNDPERYRKEIREIFQVTEMLADLQDQPRRYELELKVWRAENRANVFLARLVTPNEAERKKALAGLRELARELVDLDLQVLELQAEQLDRELGEVKDELARAREQMEQKIKSRYEALLDQAKRSKK
jgi:hypothetical protein